MNDPRACISDPHGSGSQVHLNGGAIEGGVQGVTVQAAARLQASDLAITGIQLLGLEVGGAASMLTVRRGTVDRLSTECGGYEGVGVTYPSCFQRFCEACMR